MQNNNTKTGTMNKSFQYEMHFCWLTFTANMLVVWSVLLTSAKCVIVWCIGGNQIVNSPLLCPKF